MANQQSSTLRSPATGDAITSLTALDPEIRRVSLRAAGRIFSLGAELEEFGTTIDPATGQPLSSAGDPTVSTGGAPTGNVAEAGF